MHSIVLLALASLALSACVSVRSSDPTPPPAQTVVVPAR